MDELKWELYPNWHRIYKNAVLQAKDVASNVFMKNKEGCISSKETSTWSTLKTTNFNKARRETQELKLNREKKKCWKISEVKRWLLEEIFKTYYQILAKLTQI